MKTLCLILCILTFAFEINAQSLAPAAQLNRLSRIIRGTQPTQAERQDLQKAISENNTDLFLNKKIDEYLSSEAHARQMVVRLEDLFWLRTTSIPLNNKPITLGDYAKGDNLSLYDQSNAMSYLFAELAQENLPWDQLLTKKSYRLSDLVGYLQTGQSDFGFMAALVPDLKTQTGGVYTNSPALKTRGIFPLREVQFKENDPRIAGALTTSRFFNRFVTTGLNKNRRRAAAIFRIFLCDTMSAQIPASSKQDDTIFDLMFPHSNEMTEAELIAAAKMSGDARHGTQQDCMKCHYKLDPMGKTFLTSPMALSPKASPGHLTFKRDSDLVDVPVRGIGELAQAITQQPEYASCQVEHFWKWFVEPVTRAELTGEKKDFLVKEFNRVGRKTNDFIRVLLKRPEFLSAVQPMTEQEMAAAQVKQVLGKCQNCHNQVGFASMSNEPFANFLVWPIGGSQTEMEKWVGRMANVLDIHHDGENPRMPPSDSKWKPGYQEYQVLRDWIQSGAPDEKGNKQVNR